MFDHVDRSWGHHLVLPLFMGRTLCACLAGASQWRPPLQGLEALSTSVRRFARLLYTLHLSYEDVVGGRHTLKCVCVCKCECACVCTNVCVCGGGGGCLRACLCVQKHACVCDDARSCSQPVAPKARHSALSQREAERTLPCAHDRDGLLPSAGT